MIANLFLHAEGYDIGEPNKEYLERKGFKQFVPKIQDLFRRFDGKILLPEDLAVELEGRRIEITLTSLPTKYPIYDVGPETVKRYAQLLETAKIIILNGPIGVYENDNFLAGTKGVFEAVAESQAFSVAGGGHTIAAIDKLGLTKKISYISTGGGSLMAFLRGKTLPAGDALEKAAARA